MRRLSVTASILAALLLALAPAAASAAPPTQPDNGAVSSGRNSNAVAGGPHCHIVEVNRGQGHFDSISAYPSHRAHQATGVPTGVFSGDQECDGV